MLICGQEYDNRSLSAVDLDRSKQIGALTSNSSSSNLSGLRNKIKIRLSSASSTADVVSACVDTPAAPLSTVSDRATAKTSVVARNLTFNFSRRGRGTPPRRRLAESPSVVQSSYLTLVDFVDLFRSFMLHARKDLRDLFDQQLAIAASVQNELLTPSAAVGGGVPPTVVGSGSAAAAASFPSFPVNSKSLPHRSIS